MSTHLVCGPILGHIYQQWLYVTYEVLKNKMSTKTSESIIISTTILNAQEVIRTQQTKTTYTWWPPIQQLNNTTSQNKIQKPFYYTGAVTCDGTWVKQKGTTLWIPDHWTLRGATPLNDHQLQTTHQQQVFDQQPYSIPFYDHQCHKNTEHTYNKNLQGTNANDHNHHTPTSKKTEERRKKMNSL